MLAGLEDVAEEVVVAAEGRREVRPRREGYLLSGEKVQVEFPCKASEDAAHGHASTVGFVQKTMD